MGNIDAKKFEDLSCPLRMNHIPCSFLYYDVPKNPYHDGGGFCHFITMLMHLESIIQDRAIRNPPKRPSHNVKTHELITAFHDSP